MTTSTDADVTTPGESAVAAPESRHVSPYSTREKIGRLLWAIVQATIFRYSFHNWYGWRAWLLRRFGANIDPHAVVRRTARIECPWNLTLGRNSCLGDGAIAYCLGPITIGERVSISQYAHLCAGTHDYTDPAMPLIPTADHHRERCLDRDRSVHRAERHRRSRRHRGRTGMRLQGLQAVDDLRWKSGAAADAARIPRRHGLIRERCPS